MRSHFLSKTLCILVAWAGFASISTAKVMLPAIVSDGMVLQRNTPLPVWGWAKPGEKITIEFKGKSYAVTTGDNGKWSVKLDASTEGGPFEMKIKGENEIVVKDILLGDVWMCSGQSNMEWRMESLLSTYKKEISAAYNPNIRQFAVKQATGFSPAMDVETYYGWKSVDSVNVLKFTAVGYFFAKELYEKYKVPIGLVYDNWGGTPAEAWLSPEGLKKYPHYIEKYYYINKPENREAEMQKGIAAKKGWFDSLLKEDEKMGLSGWQAATTTVSGWNNIKFPGYISQVGLKEYDGGILLRKEFDVPKEWAGKEATLLLPNVDDVDETFFNGNSIGFNLNSYAPRKYNIAAGMLKEGKNTIAMRLIDLWGNTGISGDGPLMLQVGEQILILNGDWQYKVYAEMYKLPNYPWAAGLYLQNYPAVLHNAMLSPMQQYPIKGVIWYQGESNTDRAYEYRTLFPDMISDWRKGWAQGDFPFLFVQLANYQAAAAQPSESGWAELREAQAMTLSLPNTGMAVIIDIGEANDIHPKNKKDVGIRLSLAARKIAYNETLTCSGPVYKSMKTDGNKITLAFDQTGSGLVAKGGELKQFAIAGNDKKFVWAKAKIIGNSVVVWSDNIKTPVAVRYAWADNPEGCNLYNKEGLPASPFRTDNWPGITEKK